MRRKIIMCLENNFLTVSSFLRQIQADICRKTQTTVHPFI